MHSFFFFWDASEHTCKPAAVECVYSCHRCWYWRALHIHVSLQRQKRVGFLFPCGFSPIQVIVIWWHFSVTVTYLAHLESQVGANSSWYGHQMEKLKKTEQQWVQKQATELGPRTWTWSILFLSSEMSLRGVKGAVPSVGNALWTKVLCRVARVKPAVSR